MIKRIAAIAFACSTITFNAQAGLMETDISDLSNKYGVTTFSNGTYNGGSGNSSAAFSNDSVNLLGQLQTDSLLPTLKAISTNGYGRLVSIQAFQYTGMSPFNLDLSINLHGSSSGTGFHNGIRADVGIIDAGNSLTGYDDYYFNYDFGTIFYEPAEGFGVDNTSLYINEEQDVNIQDTLSISLDMNQYFYVVTQLTVRARDGGVSDAWNTLGMTFSDTNNLVSAQRLANPLPSTSVPEPATWAILLLSLFGFAAKRKAK